MKFAATIGFFLGIVAFFSPNVIYSQEDMTFVKNHYFDNPQRTFSIFYHDIHNEKSSIKGCITCHHFYDEENQKVEDESSEDLACIDCHSPENSTSKLGLRRAFHLLCKNCHEEKEKGPVSCGNCHIK